MKILVTGGAGFIGSNFIRYWLNKYPKDEIVILDKLTYAGHKENLSGLPIKFIKGDICDPKVVKEAMEGVDVVTHFAAETHVDRSVIGPAVFLRTNIEGTQILLDEALRSGIKLFHHVSTDEVYGELPLDKPNLKFSETSHYNPNSPYAASKASADMMVRAYHRTFGLRVTITNTSNNYGPWQDPEKFIPRFVTNLLSGEKVPLMGKGENVRDWIHVEDHCRAIDLIIHAALKDGKIIGETFCVGGDSERTNLQVTKEILRIMGRNETWIKPIEHRLGHDARYAIDSSKIRKMLGWKPEHDFEQWLEKTVKWYVENKDWWRPLKEGRPNVDPEAQKQRITKEG